MMIRVSLFLTPVRKIILRLLGHVYVISVAFEIILAGQAKTFS